MFPGRATLFWKKHREGEGNGKDGNDPGAD